MKIAIVISHPVQHFCPMYASWASIEGVHLKVFFGSNLGAVKYIDPNFKQEISWNNLYLNEFEHEFLNGENTLPSTPDLDAENLEEKLTAFEPQLLVHYGYYHKLANRARNWALKNHIKTAYISDAEHRQKRPFWKELLKLPYLYFYFKKVDYFFTVGNANESYYSFYGVPKKKLLRKMFSIDIRTYNAAFDKKLELSNQFKNENSIAEEDIVFSVVGKLVEWKSQDHLIDLLLKLESTLPNKKFHLLIAGSGTMQQQWQEKAKQLTNNKVHFLGFVKPENLVQVYAATTVYIHPAKIEPHSLSISEAIYMGCPVICSNTCGSWGENDDVQINKNGFVYTHGDINDLSQKVKAIIDTNTLESFGSYSQKISRNFQQLSHFNLIKSLQKSFK
jgi:glycosyltransferase involved in cell wall biosynthesis